MKRKITSFLIVFALAITLVPYVTPTAYAATWNPSQHTTSENLAHAAECSAAWDPNMSQEEKDALHADAEACRLAAANSTGGSYSYDPATGSSTVTSGGGNTIARNDTSGNRYINSGGDVEEICSYPNAYDTTNTYINGIGGAGVGKDIYRHVYEGSGSSCDNYDPKSDKNSDYYGQAAIGAWVYDKVYTVHQQDGTIMTDSQSRLTFEALEVLPKKGIPVNFLNVGAYIGQQTGLIMHEGTDIDSNVIQYNNYIDGDTSVHSISMTWRNMQENLSTFMQMMTGEYYVCEKGQPGGSFEGRNMFNDMANEIKSIENSPEIRALQDEYAEVLADKTLSPEQKEAKLAELHQQAEDIRAQHGYSGGDNGAYYIPIEQTDGSGVLGAKRPRPDPPDPPEDDIKPKPNPPHIDGEDPPLKTYTITVNHNKGGTVTPGSGRVVETSSPMFMFDPDDTHMVTDVKIDGASIGALSSYRFFSVTSDHTIDVTFGEIPDTGEYHRIKVTCSEGGFVSPTTKVVKNGDNAYIAFSPVTGYRVNGYKIDGGELTVATGALGYTFSNITEDHTLYVEFEDDPNINSAQKYTVKVTFEGNGTVSPSTRDWAKGDTANFSFAPSNGWRVKSVSLDGSVTATHSTTYSIPNITSAHKLHVIFEEVPSISFDGPVILKTDTGNIDPRNPGKGDGTIKAGYGIAVDIPIRITNKEAIDEGSISITASWNFGNGQKGTVPLEKDSNGRWHFPVNTSQGSQKSQKIYIPESTSDGTYDIVFHISFKEVDGTVHNEKDVVVHIVVRGSMYDDDFTGDNR